MRIFDDLPRHHPIQECLYDENISVGLNEIASRIGSKHNILEMKDFELQKKLTMDYISPLLKEGALKVRVRDYEFRVATPEDEMKFQHKQGDGPMNFPGEETLYTDSTQAEAAITDIKKRWDAVSTEPKNKNYMDFSPEEKRMSSDRHRFEQFGVRFALPKGRFEL